MNKKSFKLHTIACGLLLVAMTGCTKLKEKVIDEVQGTSGSPENALGAVYSQLDNGTFVDHSQLFALQEYTTDEAILPTRGSDWGDGGIYRALHEFTWAPDHSMITNTWNNLNSGMQLSLAAINSINKASDLPNKAQMLAEAKALLALYTFQALDLYGQAPYRDDSDSLRVMKAATGIDDLIKSVESVIPDLADLSKSKLNGRFSKQAAYALLADMYLNRSVYKDRYASSFKFDEPAVDNNGTDMDKVISYTTQLINGNFKLDSNFFHNFDIENGDAKELIFVISQDVTTLRASSNNFAYMPMERGQHCSPGTRGTNASCTTPEFYYTWDNNHDDPRFQRKYKYKDGTWFNNDGTDVSVPASDFVANIQAPWFHFNRGMQVGQQYGPVIVNGDFDRTIDGRIKVSKLYCDKSTVTPMDFTPTLTFDNPSQGVFTQTQINQGVRPFKYEFDPEGANSKSNCDIPVYRLGAMYCMRAEAYLRKGLSAEALADVNMLRTSRTREELYNSTPGKALTAIDLQSLYNETGYEMYWELYRRKAAIRFGKFEAANTTKPVSQPFRRVFPIPQATRDASKLFEQNEGYKK
ncbi:glycan metabolism protein RagB [Niastella yeongjuensis]|uniref:Glycan metabolism protein RagB n=1 Tax=Niastella yeongjuensis TaxID=354355 RepID=A0A1V9FCE5_9BACT|nr:RagB/SusD family nutrient uptake outer membrane protein [Niastella yeongjuensis]OQP56054.1 glycan metabolism protein RagB [Niastella yeongjuensis]SEP24286.1 Starch-binding associating with outer membrane [Niastella yeongjuensis]